MSAPLPPRTVPVNLRVSPVFKTWLTAEKAKRGITMRELMAELATAYIAARKGRKKA